IRFDKEWEHKVSSRILHNMSLLMGSSFETVQELNRYRKDLARQVGSDSTLVQA
ncbi:MAG: ferritin-like domain-containing protein, partial [Alcaligenes sp.]